MNLWNENRLKVGIILDDNFFFWLNVAGNSATCNSGHCTSQSADYPVYRVHIWMCNVLSVMNGKCLYLNILLVVDTF